MRSRPCTPFFRAFVGLLVVFPLFLLSCTRAPRHQTPADPGDAPRALLQLKSEWAELPGEVRPHVTWVWPGNNAPEDVVTRQLYDLQQRGFGGVEIRPGRAIFPKGNQAYLSPGFFESIGRAVATARQLGLQVSVQFGPGMPFSGAWVPIEDRSQELVLTSVDFQGPDTFDANLPVPTTLEPASMRPLAVFLARPAGEDGLDPASLQSVADRIVGVAWAGREFNLARSNYIWSAEGPAAKGAIHFRRRFAVARGRRVVAALVIANGHDKLDLHINGHAIATRKSKDDLIRVDLAGLLRTGDNSIAARVENTGEQGGFALDLSIELDNGTRQTIGTDASWTLHRDAPEGWQTPDFADADWTPATVVAAPGTPGWKSPYAVTLTVPQVRLSCPIPQGRWRLLTFWTVLTGERFGRDHPEHRSKPAWTVNPLDAEAVARHIKALGDPLAAGLGTELGRTIRSMCAGSFARPTLGVLWTRDLPSIFTRTCGYDLLPHIPSLWYECGPRTAKVRYDLNATLHRLALDAAHGPFTRWCSGHNVKAWFDQCTDGPIGPIQVAGAVHRADTDRAPTTYEVSLEYRKPIVSGAKLYGRDAPTGSAGNALGNRYRVTLHDLKRATDGLLREGVGLIRYQHLLATPDTRLEPWRELGVGVPLGQNNPWWEHARGLADYAARCCLLLRQGQPIVEILVYQPQADLWSTRALFTPGTRKALAGPLGKLLVAAGHEFDIVNDDLLQQDANVDQGRIEIRGHRYRIILLPRVDVIPLETLETINRFVRTGGVAVALEKLPKTSAGAPEKPERDRRVAAIVGDLFARNSGHRSVEAGTTYFLPEFIPATARSASVRSKADAANPSNAPNLRLCRTLAHYVPPDVSPGENRISIGLGFHHRRAGDLDLYFVVNFEDKPWDEPLHFAVAGKTPELWDPLTGQTRVAPCYQGSGKTTCVDLHLAPWQSVFVVFAPGPALPHVTATTLDDILAVAPAEIVGLARAEGAYDIEFARPGSATSPRTRRIEVRDLPPAHALDGRWKIVLKETPPRPDVHFETDRLFGWATRDETRRFSGTAHYTIEFQMPESHASDNLELDLDLGTVGDVAVATLNGRPLGTAWTPPHRFRITESVQPGPNRLEIAVTNTAAARVEQAEGAGPLDDELRERFGDFKKEYYSDGRRHIEGELKKDVPLPEAGLLGPVRIVAARRVRIPLD